MNQIETIDKIIRPFRLYIAAVIGAFALSMCFWVLCFLACLFYVSTAFTLIELIGIPLGSALGIYIQDKRKYELPTYPLWRISSAFLLGIFCALLIRIWADYVGGIGLLAHRLLGRHEGSAILLQPFINAFFSLIGYQFISMFGRRKTPEPQTSPSIGIFSRVLPLGILVVLVAVAIYVSVMWQKDEKDAISERGKANRFVEQFLASVNGETAFYKTHSSESAMQSIQANRSLISRNYDRSPHSSEKGWFEYYIVFNGTQLFLAGIDTSGSEFVMKEFRYDGTSTKQTQSDGIRLGNAAEFFKQILLSISNDTDFYKKHSKESALKEIQNYRPMISNKNLLVDRSFDGTSKFYFYVLFDKQQVFEVNIEDYEKNFIVTDFKYIGQGDWKEWKIRELRKGDIDRLKNRQKN